MHQLVHVADGLKWLGPMHVYSQWGMERMCGMITRTAKSRVDANRNMELTLLLTEQKHMLGYVLNDSDWPTNRLYDLEHDSSGEEPDATEQCIEDAYGNLSLAKAFAHRIALSRPERVREASKTPLQRFEFIGRLCVRGLQGVERQRIREFMSGLHNFDKDLMSDPTKISIWRWCRFRDKYDNKKEDFKVTSRRYKRKNNLRNASVVCYKDPQDLRAYAEVQFFFLARLPSDFGSVHDLSRPWYSDSDSEEESTGMALHYLAFIRKIPVEYEDRLVRRINNAGALAVIAVGAIESLIGSLKVQNEEYLTGRFTSMLGTGRIA